MAWYPAKSGACRFAKGIIMSNHSGQTYSSFSTKSSARAAKAGLMAVVALVAMLGMALPAQAGSSLNSRGSFSFDFSFGIGGTTGRPDRFFANPYRTNCMSNRTIKGNMRSQGYSDVHYLGEWRLNKPEFSGVWAGWRYTMLVDRCTGLASAVRRVERADMWSNAPFSNSFFEWSWHIRQHH